MRRVMASATVPSRLALGSRDVRALMLLHAVYGLCGAGAIALDPPAKGWAIFACVVGYNVALPLVARAVGRSDWLAMWAFLLPLSVFQVAPDWFLSAGLGTLSFPDVGGPRLGDAIQLAMAGMWVTPLFLVLALAGASGARAAALAFAMFLATELAAPVLELWEPRNATELAGVAVYVLPPEAALGWATWLAFRLTRTSGVAARIGAAAAVATFYTGALTLAHFLTETADWSVAL